MAEDLKRVRYQLERATAADDPTERLSRSSDNPPRSWRLSDKLTDDDVAKIIKQWRAGNSQLSLARELGISQASVRRLLLERGELHSEMRQPKLLSQRFTQEAIEEIINAYRNGMTQAQVVERYDLSPSALKRLLKERGERRSDRKRSCG